MIFIIVTGIVISVILRYALCWSGIKQDYLKFVLLWGLLIGLWLLLDDRPMPIQDYPSDVAKQLAIKCEHTPGACILRARIDFATEDYESALHFLSQAKAYDEDSDILEPMYLVASLYARGITPSLEEQIQLYLMVSRDDSWLRQVYAKALEVSNRKQDALLQYQRLLAALPKQHPNYESVNQSVAQLSMQMTSSARFDPL